MKRSIFEYNSYKAFFNDLIKSYPNEGRGQRKALADYIGCQVAYITHVLAGNNHFSLEQVEAASRYFSLQTDELEFLILMLQQNRAGTKSLQKFFDEQMEKMKDQHALLKERLKIKASLSREDQALYYSSWQYAAVHMLLTIPEFRTPESIAEKLRTTSKRSLEILQFLCDKGLAIKELKQYKTNNPFLHLEKDSPLISQHHANFRMRTLQSLDEKRSTDLHYSLAFSVATKDLAKIREAMTRCLEDCADIIKPSKEEELAVLCMDFYSI